MGVRLVVGLVERRPVGVVLTPYIVSAGTSPVVLRIEGVARALTVERVEGVSSEQKALVSVLDGISEQGVARAMAPRKTTKAFYETLNEATLKQTVRPWIEKRLVQALRLMERTHTPLFVRDERYQAFNVADEVDVAPLFRCRPRLFFTLNADGELYYTLKVNDGATDVTLQGRQLRELVASPAVILSGRQLFSFDHIEAAKFRPFAERQRIRVPANLVERYMGSFVLNCLRYHPVQAYGFTVQRRTCAPKPRLVARQTFAGATLELLFDYGGELCTAASVARPVTMRHEQGDAAAKGGYIFEVTVRDLHHERAVREALLRDGGLIEVGEQLAPRTSATGADLAEWVYTHDDLLASLDIEARTDTDGAFFLGAYKLRTHVVEERDWFDIDIEVTIGDYVLPFAAFLPFIARGERNYRLPDGSMFVIPDEWLSEWSGVLPFMQSVAGHLRVSSVHRALLPPLLLEGDDAKATQTPDFAPDPTFRPVTELRATLRPYQLVGLQWLLHVTGRGRGAILADDMGLGKTLQTAALLAHTYHACAPAADDLPTLNASGLPPSLIVMPVSLVHNWRAELARFTPSLHTYVYTGRQVVAGTAAERILAQYHIVITSYGILRNNVDTLARIHFHFLILDESHLAKNPSSKTYQALTSLRSRQHVNLTGTPVENSLTDLWAQMNLVNPGLLGSRRAFEAFFRGPIEQADDQRTRQRLRQITAPYILRRTKGQVLRELPELTVQTVACPLDEEQESLYEREKSMARNQLTGVAAPSRRFVALQALTRLRLIANHPALCLADYQGGSGKLDMVLDYIDNIAAGGNKMLVFSSFVRDLRLLSERLAERHMPHSMLTGQTQHREEAIERFNNDPLQRAFLISLKAGGVGLNLTSASYVLILNPWWNPAAEEQAYARAHRIGQQRAVTVYRFISTGTIEEKIDQLQQRKRQIASDAISEADLQWLIDASLFAQGGVV